MHTFEFRPWRDIKGGWLWTLRDARTDQPIAVSGVLYPDYQACINAIHLIKHSVNASVIRDA